MSVAVCALLRGNLFASTITFISSTDLIMF